jgi:hypothetical protein
VELLPVGKRAVQSRSLTVQCCTTDLCNGVASSGHVDPSGKPLFSAYMHVHWHIRSTFPGYKNDFTSHIIIKQFYYCLIQL